MYDFLSGTLASRGPTEIVVDVGGVGYRVEIPLLTSGRLPQEGSPVRILVHHRIQDDRARLFGFLQESERQLFRNLIAVAGIGPGTALALLSGQPPEEVWRLIRDGDWKGLTRTRGVGSKIAQRVCVELKDRADRVAGPAAAGPTERATSGDEDAVSALLVLGYTDSQARKAVDKARHSLPDVDAPLELIVRAALRHA
jgi:Holliday junction DNA helicase RuvA